MKLGIRNKFVLSIEVTVFVVTMFAGVATFFVLRNITKQQTFSKLDSVATLKENNIKWFIDEITSEIVYLENRESLKSNLLSYFSGGGLTSKNEVIKRMNEELKFKNIFSEVLVLDKNGMVVMSTNATDEGKIRSEEDYFVKAKEGTFLQSYFFDISTGQPAMMVGTPILDKKGAFLGVMAGKVNVGSISQLMGERASLGNTGESFLINSFNLVVTDLLKEPGSVFKKSVYLPQVEACLGGQNNDLLVTDYHGDLVYGNWRWFPEIKSCIVTKIDYSEVTAPLLRVFLVLVFVLLAGGVLMGIFGYIFASAIVRPIGELREAVQKMKEGDLAAKSIVESHDEIGEVAESFNEMAGKLKSSYEGLESKVKEKTEALEEKVTELQKMNKLMVGRENVMFELKKKLREKENV